MKEVDISEGCPYGNSDTTEDVSVERCPTGSSFDTEDNWFERGKALLIENVSKNSDVSIPDVERVYEALQCEGIIDYDVEKEVFYVIVHGEEE